MNPMKLAQRHDDIARRICIQHEIANRAAATDQYLGPVFVADLAAALGRVGTAVTAAEPADIRAALIELAGDAQAWIEQIDREASL